MPVPYAERSAGSDAACLLSVAAIPHYRLESAPCQFPSAACCQGHGVLGAAGAPSESGSQNGTDCI